MDQKSKILRRVLRLGGARAITIPRDWLAEAEYVWVEVEEGRVVVRPAEVR